MVRRGGSPRRRCCLRRASTPKWCTQSSDNPMFNSLLLRSLPAPRLPEHSLENRTTADPRKDRLFQTTSILRALHKIPDWKEAPLLIPSSSMQTELNRIYSRRSCKYDLHCSPRWIRSDKGQKRDDGWAQTRRHQKIHRTLQQHWDGAEMLDSWACWQIPHNSGQNQIDVCRPYVRPRGRAQQQKLHDNCQMSQLWREPIQDQ